MIGGIITILLGICSFVMLTQPAFSFYGGEGNELASWFKDLFNDNLTSNASGYDLLKFEENQDIFWLLGNIFLIIAMVFCGLMLLFTIINLISQSCGKDKVIGTRVFAILFFVFAFVSAIMYVLFANKIVNSNIDSMIDAIKNGEVVFTIGYGMICFVIASLLSMFFASGKKKRK